jgi:hypothetical protein
LQEVLAGSGANRVELEKVLRHYKDEPEKLAAAVFLIENMPYHYGYEGKGVGIIKRALRYVHEDNDNIPDEIWQEASSFPDNNLTKVNDAQAVTADFLIENIDMAFAQWKERPWNKQLSFEDFCEYLLPYRVRDEPLENWRKAYYDKYAHVLDSLYAGTDVIEAAHQLNMYISRTETVAFNSDFKPVSPGALFFLDYKCGSCFDLRDASIYMLRAVGIPAAAHFYRFSPNAMGTHTWAVVRDTTGKDVVFRTPGVEVGRDIDLEYPKGKAYRLRFAPQEPKQQAYSAKDEVLSFFKNPYITDVTANYTGENKLETSITRQAKPYVYLGIHTSWRTIPIAVTRAKRGKAVFKNVEPGLIYQQFYAKNNQLIPAGYPVLFMKDSTHTFLPDTSRLEDLTLYRKYVIADWLYMFMNYMVNGLIEGSSVSDFSKIDFSYLIKDSLRNIITQTIYPETTKPVRYIRFSSSDSSWINIAEMSFFAKEDTLTTLKDIAVRGGRKRNFFRNGYLQNICDGDPLTYYSAADRGTSVVLDFKRAVQLYKMEITPRTDDNFIRIGDLYELHYHAGGAGWKSVGRQVATQLFLHYANVPSNALLWLQNHTRGREEQVFYMKDGRQVFI